MIRQIRRLLRPLPPAGGPRSAPAVYFGQTRAGARPAPAADQGFEGVACVDDASRAAIVFLRLWRMRRDEADRVTAERLLAFVASMQADDGRFHNFVLDWDGTPNVAGPTSHPGGPWSARATHALAAGAVEGDDDGRLLAAARAGFFAADRECAHLDIRAVLVLAGLELERARPDRAVRARALEHCDAIVAGRRGAVMCDDAREGDVHLWGHLQEAATAYAGMRLGRPGLIAAARGSAEALLVPVAASGFARPTVTPFEVSSAIAGLDAVAAATGERRFRRAAMAARAWFLGRNTAGMPVYDSVGGYVADGIDDGRVSRNSGAEANIEGALAFLTPDTVPRRLSPDRQADRGRVVLQVAAAAGEDGEVHLPHGVGSGLAFGA